jgi:exopolysaccharide biosynthesis protein
MYQGKHVQKKSDAEPVRRAKPVRAAGTAEPEEAAAAVKTKTAAPRKKRKKKLRGWKKALVIICAVLVLLGSLYSLFVFSDIPFFKYWRTIYIETAMSTMTHQWLATDFIPKSVIDEVQKNTASENEKQKSLSSKWWGDTSDDTKTSDEKTAFYEKFWELDQDKFEAYLKKHPSVLKDGYSGIVIDNLDCSDESLTTSFGEIIRAINAPDNVIIMRVTGDNYVGTLACVKDPEQLSLEKANSYGAYGEVIEEYCKDNVLATNASGFQDNGGVGNGGDIVGSFVLNGKEIGNPAGGYLYYGFKQDNRLYITSSIADKSEYKWAIQFAPALIVNGESQVKGSYGWGLQPRSSIGQTKKGEMLFLIVDGRQVGYSIGCTVSDCADILLRHNAYQAGNLDGGSSAIMAYEGSIITKNSSASSNGRTLPNAFVVAHPKS